MNKNSFKWAHKIEANIAEPVPELSENGWKCKDIPKASNMNWIFRKISDDLVDLSKQIVALDERILRLSKRFDSWAGEQVNLGKVLRNNMISTNQAFRQSQDNRITCRLLDHRLEKMEKSLRDMNEGFQEALKNTNDFCIALRDRNYSMYSQVYDHIEKIEEFLEKRGVPLRGLSASVGGPGGEGINTT